MSSSYFTNESLKSGWKYFHDKFVGDDKPVFNFDNVPIDTIKKNLEISSDPYDFHKLIITKIMYLLIKININNIYFIFSV